MPQLRFGKLAFMALIASFTVSFNLNAMAQEKDAIVSKTDSVTPISQTPNESASQIDKAASSSLAATKTTAQSNPQKSQDSSDALAQSADATASASANASASTSVTASANSAASANATASASKDALGVSLKHDAMARINDKIASHIDDFELTQKWNHLAMQAKNSKDAKSFLYLHDLTSGDITNGTQRLEQELRAITKSFSGELGLAVVDEHGLLVMSNMQEFPLMSSMKFPLAYAVLRTMHERGDNLEHLITIEIKDLHQSTYSPLYERLVKEGYASLHSDDKLSASELKKRKSLTFSLKELIDEAVRNSDNNACDILLTKYLNGPKDLNKFLKETLGIKRINIAYTEAQMTDDVKLSYSNYASPVALGLVFSKYLNDDVLDTNDRALLEGALYKPNSSKPRIMAALDEVAAFEPLKAAYEAKTKGKEQHITKVFSKTGQGAMLDAHKRIAVNDAAYVEFHGKPYIVIALTKDIVSESQDAPSDTILRANTAISKAVAAAIKYAERSASY